MTDNTWTQRAGMTSDTDTDNLETYAEQAEASKVAAAASETAAAGSASSASASSATATTKAAESASSATQSASSATASAASATQSASSATASAGSAATSGAAQTAAETAKTGAETAQAAAETAKTAAETAETNAATSEAASLVSKNAAATSASTASTEASNSASSATAAEASNVAAGVAKVAAETAETNAETAQAASETAKTASEAAKVAAETAETNASTSSATATTQAGIATTKAGEAAASATASANSATASEAAKDAALAALDNFDDRYLGAKASDPTVDNDGNPLISGALYFNTTDDVMKVYEGSQWVAAYASLSGALLVANNLSDLASASAGRINLGLGTAATTASTDYATAAQGALAASATQPGDLATVATSGAYSDLSGTPSPFDPSTLATVATSGAYSDLSGKPTLGTAASTASTDYATAAQGALAASATQPGDLGTAATAAATDFVAVTGDSMTGDLDITGTLTSDGLTVDGSSVVATFGNSASNNYAQIKRTTSNVSTLTLGVSSNLAQITGGPALSLSTGAADGTSEVRRMLISSGGDISFFEDTGTTPKFFWDSSAERLGIGTSFPDAKLSITENIVGDLIKVTGANATDLRIGNHALANGGIYINSQGGSGDLRLQTQGSTRMTLDSSGHVLINNTAYSASGTLVVKQTADSKGIAIIDSADANTLFLENDGTINKIRNNSAIPIAFETNNTERMRIDSSGRVLLGTTTAGESSADDLTIATTGQTGITLRSGTANAGAIYFADGTSGTAQYSGYIYYGHSNNVLGFATNATERMRIDSSGNLLVGKTTIATGTAGIALRSNGEVRGTADGDYAARFSRLSSDGAIVGFEKDGSTVGSIGTQGGDLWVGTGNTGAYFWDGSNAIAPWNTSTNTARDAGIDLGTSSVRFKDAHFSGTANAANFNTTSDATLKTNVETLSGSLDAVKSLRGVSFDWLENGGSEIGVIAQEVEAVLPDVVSTNDEGIKSVKYGNMVAVLIEAIKEQQLRIEALEAKLGE